MRNFDERKAEIFRRSENRIKERKRNRNRILALCVPLCLCIAILSVIYLPDMMISPDKSNSVEDECADGTVGSVSEFIYTSFEIKGTVTAENDTDKDNIKDVYDIIQSAFTFKSFDDEAEDKKSDTNDSASSSVQKPSTQKDEGTSKDEENYSTGTAQTFSEGVTYTLTFSADNGKKVIYTLCDGVLTNDATSESVILTEDQLKNLYEKVFTVTYGKE